MESLQGHFLVASPHLSDGNFNRSVVLMIKHDEEGAFGLILNRPTASRVAEVWKSVADETIETDEAIYVGGPVTTALVSLHTLKSAGEMRVLTGVYFSAQPDHLRRVVSTPKKPFRFFSGYSGWGSGQLEGELEVGGWLVTSATADLVFGAPEDLWERIVRVIAQDILSPVVPTKHAPKSPGLN
jgi:putative transcriptional regulator